MIPVPESGTPAAIGYAQGSGIPYGSGLVKNAYVGRTFIQPSQTIRQLGIRLKLNPLRDVIRGKRLIVVDDSIVRGNTQRALVRMLREAGAVEVHVRIASPPVRWPCFYGIDFASRAELIANGLDIDGVRRSIGADSLGYVSLEGLVAASEQPRTRLCTACFDGEYPIPLPEDALIGKHLIEDMDAAASDRARSGPRRRYRAGTARTVARAGIARGRRTPAADHRRGGRRSNPVQIRSTMETSAVTTQSPTIRQQPPPTQRPGWTSPRARKPWTSSSRSRHAANRPEVLGGIGGFAGLFELRLDRWTEPVLASSTDGVGTKIAVAQALDIHDTIGIDLVAMVVDDLVVCGAEPLFLQDYIAVGKVVPERIAMLVKGIAEGCVQSGCALLGGETAEHPGLMAAATTTSPRTGVGVVEAQGSSVPTG